MSKKKEIKKDRLVGQPDGEKAATTKGLTKQTKPVANLQPIKNHALLSKHRRYRSDLADYQPIRLFKGGFEIKPLTFIMDSSSDLEAIIEKMTELSENLDTLINQMDLFQNCKEGPFSKFERECLIKLWTSIFETWPEEPDNPRFYPQKRSLIRLARGKRSARLDARLK